MIRVLALALLLVPGAARGNPLDAFGFGARAPAMGGAHTALSSDASANYYNPGALGAIETIAIDAGYQLASPSLSINGGDQDVDTSRGVHVGLVAPGQVAGVPLAIGMAAFIPDERFTRSRTLAQERVRWALYDNRPQRVFLAAHLSVRVVRGLTVGAGVAFMSRTQGDLVLGGRLGFPNASDSDLAPAIDFDLVTVRYPQAGLLWEAAPWLSVGVTYRHPFVLEIEQAFRIEGDIGPTEADALVKDGFLSLLSRAKDLFQPLQVALGVSVAPDERWRLAVDVVYQRWSAFDNPSARIDLDLDLGDFRRPRGHPAPRGPGTHRVSRHHRSARRPRARGAQARARHVERARRLRVRTKPRAAADRRHESGRRRQAHVVGGPRGDAHRAHRRLASPLRRRYVRGLHAASRARAPQGLRGRPGGRLRFVRLGLAARHGNQVALLKLRVLVALFASACGTGQGEGGGDALLPTLGAGPFGKATDPEGTTPIKEPVLLFERDVDLTDPSVLARTDGSFRLWFTRAPRDGTPPQIWSALLPALGERPTDIEPALVADEPWEAEAVMAPSVVQTRDALVMYYATSSGHVGLAISTDDGATWTKQGSILDDAASPGAAHLDDARFVYFTRGPNIHFAHATGDAPLQVAPVPALGPGPVGAFDNAGVGDPQPVVRVMPTGRLHVSLYYTGSAGGEAPTAIGHAGSRNGLAFARFEGGTPILEPEAPADRAPSVLVTPISATLFYAEPFRDAWAIAFALHP